MRIFTAELEIPLTVNIFSTSLEPVKEFLGVVSGIALSVCGKAEDGQTGASQLVLESRDLRNDVITCHDKLWAFPSCKIIK